MKKPHACTIKQQEKKANEWEVIRLGMTLRFVVRIVIMVMMSVMISRRNLRRFYNRCWRDYITEFYVKENYFTSNIKTF